MASVEDKTTNEVTEKKDPSYASRLATASLIYRSFRDEALFDRKGPITAEFYGDNKKVLENLASLYEVSASEITSFAYPQKRKPCPLTHNLLYRGHHDTGSRLDAGEGDYH